MSTPTAAGTTALTVGITVPAAAPMPQWTSGMAATHRWMNGREAKFRSCRRALAPARRPRPG